MSHFSWQAIGVLKAQIFEPLRLLSVATLFHVRVGPFEVIRGFLPILVEHYGGLILVFTRRFEALAISELPALCIQQNGYIEEYHNSGDYDQVETVAQIRQPCAIPVLLLLLRQKDVVLEVLEKLYQPGYKCHNLGSRC